MTTPRKRFGQHFLCDQHVIGKIVGAIRPDPRDHLIEIGPGQGAITVPILRQIKKLEVIELDRDLIPELKNRCERYGELTVYSADVLDFNFANVKTDNRQLRVFGNLPYNISTPLIFHLLSFADMIADMTFMLQKEVAERLAAAKHTEHYGRLSVMVQYHCAVDLLFDVPRGAFFPPPKVESSIVRLVPHRQYPVRAKDEATFSAVVKQAFSMRRKTLRNALKTMVTDEVWEALPIRSDLRPEELSVSDFVAISDAIKG